MKTFLTTIVIMWTCITVGQNFNQRPFANDYLIHGQINNQRNVKAEFGARDRHVAGYLYAGTINRCHDVKFGTGFDYFFKKRGDVKSDFAIGINAMFIKIDDEFGDREWKFPGVGIRAMYIRWISDEVGFSGTFDVREKYEGYVEPVVVSVGVVLRIKSKFKINYDTNSENKK